MSEQVRIECPLNPHWPQCFFPVLCAMTTPRTANPARSILAAEGLTRDVMDSMVASLAWAVFSAGKTLVSTNFAVFSDGLA